MSSNLLDYQMNKYSQAGQDGIIEYIFNILGIKKGHFVEFGAWDGIYLSNCRKLFEEGWSGIFIEADKKRSLQLQKNYALASRVVCINKRVEIEGENRFDKIIAEYAPDKPITFLSIDIDGIELETFESIEEYLPMVACIEGGKGAHPLDPRMPAYCTNNIGQSLKVIKETAEKKGYAVLCSFQDTFLIKKGLLSKFNPPSDLFQLYINGYKAQAYMHIPMYAERLRGLHRKNVILDYILKETNYCSKYRIYEEEDTLNQKKREWAKENEQQISGILASLPKFLYAPQMKGCERILINLMNLRRAIPEKRYSGNLFWKSVFYIRDSLKNLARP